MTGRNYSRRTYARIALPVAALATDPDVGGTPDDAPDELFQPFAEFLGAVIEGDAEAIRAAAEEIIARRVGDGRDNSRSNATTRHGRKKSVLLADDGDDDSPERGTTRHGRKKSVLLRDD